MTLAETLDPFIAEPASRFVLEQYQPSLADAVEQLVALRFSIVLSAKWESSGILSGHAKTELRDELRQLRSRYSDKIDEIAMNYGVQAAMDAREGVERGVIVPKTMAPPRNTESIGFHDF
jgi:hypothetical protein